MVDDEPDIVSVVRMTLEAEGFEVSTGYSAQEAFQSINRNGLPHLAVLDIMMPGTDGITLARKIQKFSDLPVIMLTAIDEEATVVKVIEEVAEDYVTKPFKPKELAARVKRVIRRMGDFAFRLESLTVIDDRLAVDFAGKKVLIDEKPVSLTPTETKILHILIRSARRTVTTRVLPSSSPRRCSPGRQPSRTARAGTRIDRPRAKWPLARRARAQRLQLPRLG